VSRTETADIGDRAGGEEVPAEESGDSLPEEMAPRVEPPAPKEADDVPLSLEGLGDPRREGSLLLHDPDGVPGYLKGDGRGLSAQRKQLLMAYALLVSGRNGLVPEYTKGLDGAPDITTAESELLRDALDGSGLHARNASHALQPNPLVLGVTMALMARQGLADLKAQRCEEAAETFSELIQAELDAPWSAESEILRIWAQRLHEAQACHRWRSDGAWPALETEVRDGDTLIAIRKRILAEHPGMRLCTGLIERSNQLTGYLQEGQPLRVPTAEVHVMIDLSAKWLLYYHGREVVGAWEVAIGSVDTPTTPGHYTAGEKTPEPTWFRPGYNPVAYGEAGNLLGTRWITLEGSDGLGIHGTWEPATIGQAASEGCIRMRNEAVESLFEILPKGSGVVVRP
jgi:hypothetical protein